MAPMMIDPTIESTERTMDAIPTILTDDLCNGILFRVASRYQTEELLKDFKIHFTLSLSHRNASLEMYRFVITKIFEFTNAMLHRFSLPLKCIQNVFAKMAKLGSPICNSSQSSDVARTVAQRGFKLQM